jgi:mycothiol system anti-sigma-R factor
MECEEVLERLWEYLDHELAPEETAAVRAHLGRCAACYPSFCCHRAFLELLARQRVGCSAPPALLARVRSCFKLGSLRLPSSSPRP